MGLEEKFEQLNNKLDKLIDIMLGQHTNKILCPYSLYDFIFIWLSEYKKPKIKEKTYKEYSRTVDTYIVNKIENKLLSDYSSLDLTKTLNSIENCRAKETLCMVLYDVFNTAFKLGYISQNIMDNVARYKHDRAEGVPLNKKEEKHFLKLISGTRYECVFKFILYTGIRRNEALTLRWEDIDYKNKTILIRGTKTKKSYRVIPLFENVKNVLKCVSKNQCNRADIVFDFNGEYLTKVIHKLGMKRKIKIKDLRTTFATRCMENGVSEKVISKWLGHTNTTTTSKYYEKVQSDFESREAKKINKAFEN